MTTDKSDPNHAICQDAKRRLKEATDAKGRKFEIIELPLDSDLSYMNFYIGDVCILVPVTTKRDEDEFPMGVLREVFGDFEVVSIDGTVLGEGGIHCFTRQFPKG